MPDASVVPATILEVRKQKWNEAYHYDEGYAVWDVTDNVQVGWYASKSAAQKWCDEVNEKGEHKW